jgi:hypothetical protein
MRTGTSACLAEQYLQWGDTLFAPDRTFSPIPSGFQGLGVRGGQVTKSHTKTRTHQKRDLRRLQICSPDGGLLCHTGSIVFFTTADAQKT